MRGRRYHLTLLAVVLLLTTPALVAPARAAPDPTAGRCFPETGFCVRGRFLDHWLRHGHLPSHGYPLSDEFVATLEDGKPYTVQYFERTRLEFHPEHAGPPHEVQLGQFGRRIVATIPEAPVAPVAPDPPGPATRFFPETGHNVRSPFAGYWGQMGGLARFGYPLTEAFEQRLEDGNTYTVQYFERARLEFHPELTSQ